MERTANVRVNAQKNRMPLKFQVVCQVLFGNNSRSFCTIPWIESFWFWSQFGFCFLESHQPLAEVPSACPLQRWKYTKWIPHQADRKVQVVMPRQRKTEMRRIAPCQVQVADDCSESCKESCVTPVTKRHDETHPETRVTLHPLRPFEIRIVHEFEGGVGVQIVQSMQSVSVIEVPQIPHGQMYKGKICGLSNFYVSSCHRRPRCIQGVSHSSFSKFFEVLGVW